MAKTPLEALDEYFFRELRQARNYPEAYEKATAAFERAHNLSTDLTYDAYRMRKKRKTKR